MFHISLSRQVLHSAPAWRHRHAARTHSPQVWIIADRFLLLTANLTTASSGTTAAAAAAAADDDDDASSSGNTDWRH